MGANHAFFTKLGVCSRCGGLVVCAVVQDGHPPASFYGDDDESWSVVDAYGTFAPIENHEAKQHLTVVGVLRHIDSASVLFFLGILLAVAALQEAGHLILAAEGLRAGLDNVYLIDMAIGLLSAIVDNVPLVAASMGMYDVVAVDAATDAWSAMFVQDGIFWQFLAYCAGTGGSALIIGSAAGVAVMGLERIDFVWYLKKISLLAILGYLAGAGVYVLMFA